MLVIGSGHGEVTGRLPRCCGPHTILLTGRPQHTPLLPTSQPGMIYVLNPGYPDTPSSGSMPALSETQIVDMP